MEWTWGQILSSGLAMASCIVTVIGAPAGWPVAVAYLTLAATTGKTVAQIIGAMTSPVEADGACARAFGGVDISKPDGKPYRGPFYGDDQYGLSTPDHEHYTLYRNGTVGFKNACVRFSQAASVGETWKMRASCSVAAWVEGGWIRTEDAEAGLVYSLSAGKDGQACLVDSKLGAVDSPEGHYVSEE